MAPKPVKGRPLLQTRAPRLLQKGGVEVLGLKIDDNSTIEIEATLDPRMGLPPKQENNSTVELSSGFSEQIVLTSTLVGDNVPANSVPRYSCCRIKLPKTNDDITTEKIVMWEAVAVKTEVVGVPSMVNIHSAELRNYKDQNLGNGGGRGVEGINFHFFAVGGDPLDLLGFYQNPAIAYTGGNLIQPHTDIYRNAKWTSDTTGPKAKLLNDDRYPVECWCPDPTLNENTRYFGTFTGGGNTPPILQVTNTTSTLLLDENGIGPLCKNDYLYLTAVDICGVLTNTQYQQRWRGLPRYFKIKLRKRIVKNPIPVSTLIEQLYASGQQQMQGQNDVVEEVRVYSESDFSGSGIEDTPRAE